MKYLLMNMMLLLYLADLKNLAFMKKHTMKNYWS